MQRIPALVAVQPVVEVAAMQQVSALGREQFLGFRPRGGADDVDGQDILRRGAAVADPHLIGQARDLTFRQAAQRGVRNVERPAQCASTTAGAGDLGGEAGHNRRLQRTRIDAAGGIDAGEAEFIVRRRAAIGIDPAEAAAGGHGTIHDSRAVHIDVEIALIEDDRVIRALDDQRHAAKIAGGIRGGIHHHRHADEQVLPLAEEIEGEPRG